MLFAENSKDLAPVTNCSLGGHRTTVELQMVGKLGIHIE
jgi:hypothetical protein